MRVLIKNELERAFKNKWFYATIIIGLIIVIYDICEEVIPVRMNMDIYINTSNYTIPNIYNSWMELNASTAHNLFHFIYPLLVCIPYSITMYTDVESKYLYNILTRTNKKNYFLAKLVVQFIVGFAVVIITMSASLALTAAIIPAGDPFYILNYAVTGKAILARLFYTRPLLTSLMVIFFDSLIFAIIGCISYIFAYMLKNGIMVMVSAFTLYFFELVVSPLLGNSTSLCMCTYLFDLTRSGLIILLSELAVIVVAILCMYYIRSRQRDEL